MIAPSSTVPSVHEKVAGALLGVGDREAHAIRRITPVSPTWPPDFGIERRLVEDERPVSPAFSSATSWPSRTSAATTPSALSVS